MKQHIEEYGLTIIVTIVILTLISAIGLLNTEVKMHVNDKLQTALTESEITQLDPDGEAVSGTGDGGFVVDIGNAYGVLPIEKGGTGATSLEQAKAKLGLGEVVTMDKVPIENGGTNATTESAAAKNLGAIKNTETLNAIYPVGSVYFSVDDENPANLFGGTWTRIKDRFLLGAGYDYTAGSTGGTANGTVVSHSHTVSGTANSAGSHSHVIDAENNSGYSSRYHPYRRTSRAHYGWHYLRYAGDHSHTVSGRTDSEGVSTTGANMPPYLAVYVWERTA